MPDSSDTGVGSHQSRGWLRRKIPTRRWLVVSAAASVVALVAAAVLISAAGEPPAAARTGCSGEPVIITVAAPPGLAPALGRLAGAWTASLPEFNGRCLAAAVSPAEPGDIAAALGPDWDTGRGGPRPDVWVPDSSLWLSIAAGRPEAAAMLPAEPASIATSPIVLAVRQPLAQALGWPQRTLDWADVLDAFTGDGWPRLGHPEWSSLRIGMTDPNTSTPGLAAILSILGAGGSADPGSEQLVASLRFLQAVGAVAPDTAEFFAAQAAVDATPGATGPDTAVAAFPAAESDVARYDLANTGQALVPVYANPPIVADYPYAVLNASWVDAGVRAAAGQFLDYLRGSTGRDSFGASGLRGADHSVRDPATLPVADGFPANLGGARPNADPVTIDQVVSRWAGLQRPSNMLVALDTSGSMAQPVPGTALTRLQLMQQTARTGFGLLNSRNNIGLWGFSGDRAGPDEFRQLVAFGPSTGPIGPMSRQQAMLGALDQLRATGHTPLYDTVYAAFHEMQGHWQADSANAVVVITDGANDLPGGGLTLDDLVGKLTREQRADRPVQVINIAIGPEADAASLQRISQATGGRTFVARDPAGAVQTLVLAFAGRLS
jgi:Ca-activated chloride channel family protein